MAAVDLVGATVSKLENDWNLYVRRIASGDQLALATLYDASNHLVYGLALRVLGNPADAEEVTLDTYSQIWRTAASFDPQRGSVAAWLITMARSRAIDKRRNGTGRREWPLAKADGVAGPFVEPDTGNGPVRAALAALAPEQREAIELAFWFGFSHSELAARLHQPLGTIKTRIRLGIIKLRAQLGA
jgi:RNA polymerase sigma-70 factor (ECF subfamily)